MDRSVYTPGAGHTPRVLAGRDNLLHDWQLMLNDLAVEGRVRAQDTILAGPRGVGKTVTVAAFGDLADATGYEVVSLQAVAGRVGLVESLVERATTKLRLADETASAWQRAKHAFDRIAGFNLGVAGITAGITTHSPDHHPTSAAAPNVDAGLLAETLVTLADEVRADRPSGGLLITVDELQVASPTDLALLAATLHRLNVDHPAAAIAFAGTGLPHLPQAMRTAGVTHPDRLFALEPLPLTLEPADAAYAVVEPARRAGVSWEHDAVTTLVQACNAYPAHLQLFAHTTWGLAEGPDIITVADVTAALPRAASLLERRTLGPRWDRMPDRQMEFLAALAVNGGRTTSRQLAQTLGRAQKEISWIRQTLLEEGDVYSPKRGHLAMAVPLMGPYVLARYEKARALADGDDLLTLEAMKSNLNAPGQLLPTGDETLEPNA